jgi:hypothetical protein
MKIDPNVRVAVDDLFREIVALETVASTLEDAIEFDDSVSAMDIELLIKEIEFIMPSLNASAAVIKERAKQYLAEKRSN